MITTAGATLVFSPPRAADAADDPAVVGQWSTVFPLPIVAIHAALSPDGTHALVYSDADTKSGHGGPGYSAAYLVEIPPGQLPGQTTFVPNSKTNLFCSGAALMADGRLFVTGGHENPNYYGVSDVNIFDWGTGTWQTTSGFPASDARWYASTLMLPSGDMLALSGTVAGLQTPNKLPQVWQAASGAYRDLTGAELALHTYPKTFVAPNGLVFDAGPEVQTRFLDTSGAGRWISGPSHRWGPRVNGPAVMYDVGKILYAGGSKSNGTAPVATAETIDLNAAKPAWQPTGSMRFARRLANGTVLPDGTVLVTGGSSSALFNDAAGAVLAAEAWDPATGGWATMASMQVPRLYHSTALLLPDGRVLSMGGGRPKAAHGGQNNTNGEIFSPPYLFKGPRPTITSAPASVGYGQTFTVQTPDAGGIAKVTLVRLSVTTHTHNTNQRLVPLGFGQTAGGLSVMTPSDRNILLPGHYMLFILNGAGVPSTASIIEVG
jgi:galactose oxidase-like protein/Kelch motif protein